MTTPAKPATPVSRRAKALDHAGTSEPMDSADVAEASLPRAHWGLGGLSAEELNDLNSRLAPALQCGDEFDALWSVWSQGGDYVAATAAGLAAAACRFLINEIHAAWYELRACSQTVEAAHLPFAPLNTGAKTGKKETRAQALNRVVTEIKAHDEEILLSVRRTMRQFGDEGAYERAVRIRSCPEWKNRKGILRDHPTEACVLLFRKLLVAPPVYMEVRDDLSKISVFRRQAIAFRQKVLDHEKELGAGETTDSGTGSQRRTLSGLSHEENRLFHELLDTICAGDIRTRHGNKDSERISTIRLIAEHFRSYLNLSKAAATDLFGVEPWSSGIANLAHAALYFQVTTEDVRGALKNWASD